jgi:hypothetical protein
LYLLCCNSIFAYIMTCYNHCDERKNKKICTYLMWFACVYPASYIFRVGCYFIVYLLSRSKKYMTRLANPDHYGNFLIIALILVVVFGEQNISNDQVRRTIGGVTIIFVMAKLINWFRWVPFWSLSINMAILKKVSITFIQICPLFAVILSTFAFSFYTMIGNYGDTCEMEQKVNSSKPLDQFSNAGLAVANTILLFSGQYDVSNIDFQQNFVVYIIFVVFILFISVVMVNLASALAVSDTQVNKNLTFILIKN